MNLKIGGSPALCRLCIIRLSRGVDQNVRSDFGHAHNKTNFNFDMP